MKACLIHGNTRSNSNTEALAMLFADDLNEKGVEVCHFFLRDKNIQSCVGCNKCHSVLDSFGCVINDDMQEIAKEILLSDLIVYTSPIYTWMPTPSQKAVMDRTYAFTKYPKNDDAFCLLKKQKYAMIATSGDECERNCDLFDESLRRMAKFANLSYLGYLAVKDPGNGSIANSESISKVRVFANKCFEAIK